MSSIDFHPERLLYLTCKSRSLGVDEKFPIKGLDFISCLHQRSIEAMSYCPEPFEEEQMDALIEHRSRLLLYSRMVDAAGQGGQHFLSLIHTIQKDIEQLSNFSGRQMFCFPGGTTQHAVCYELAREIDGSYSFLIYNRGGGCNDSELHGKVLLRNSQGQAVGRTRVQIKGLAKEDLTNRLFLTSLILSQHRTDVTMKDLYKEIKEHLLINAGGWVREAPEEKLWSDLLEMSIMNQPNRDDDFLNQIEQKLLSDPDFHTVQTMAGCTESNTQTPECFIIESNLRRKLKLHAIKTTYKLILDPSPIPRWLIDRMHCKMENLNTKIDFWNYYRMSSKQAKLTVEHLSDAKCLIRPRSIY